MALPARVVDERGVEYHREDILKAMRRWAAFYGEAPTNADWDPGRARRIGHYWRIERFRAGSWPTATAVLAAFRTFNAAVEAAGLIPQPSPRKNSPRPASESTIALSVATLQHVSGKPPACRRCDRLDTAIGEAAAAAPGPGVEQVIQHIRLLAAARVGGDEELVYTQLVRLAGSLLAWADKVAGANRGLPPNPS